LKLPVTSRAEKLLLGAAVLGFALLAGAVVLPGDEDAFIYFRFALNVAHGLGLVFNPGERVEGFSSPIWMALLGAGTAWGWAPHVLARGLGVLAGAGTVIASWRLAAALGCGAVARLGVACTVALNAWAIVWSQSGLETPLYSLLLTLSATAYFALGRSERDRSAPELGTGLLLGLTALARPEGALLPLLVLIDAARWMKRRSWLRLALPVAILGGSYLAFRLAYFGAWLPNTSVKAYPLHVDRSVPQALDFLIYTGGSLLLVPLLWRWLARSADRVSVRRLGVLWLGAATLSLGFHFAIGGDYRPGFRYLLPALPLLAATSWRAIELLGFAAHRRAPLVAAPLLGALLLAGSARELGRGAFDLSALPTVFERWRDPFADRSQWGVEVCYWLVSHVPAGSTVAYGQMGKAPYFAALSDHPLRFLDTVGWVDRDIGDLYRLDRKLGDFATALWHGASFSETLQRGREERARAFVDLLLARRPDFILIEPDLQHAGMNRVLPADPRFQAAYEALGGIGQPHAIQVFRRRTAG